MPKDTPVRRVIKRLETQASGPEAVSKSEVLRERAARAGRKAEHMKSLLTENLKSTLFPIQSHLPKGASLSPKGDVGKLSVKESHAISRKLQEGHADFSSSYLPYHTEPMSIDPEFGPGDKVV